MKIRSLSIYFPLLTVLTVSCSKGSSDSLGAKLVSLVVNPAQTTVDYSKFKFSYKKAGTDVPSFIEVVKNTVIKKFDLQADVSYEMNLSLLNNNNEIVAETKPGVEACPSVVQLLKEGINSVDFKVCLSVATADVANGSIVVDSRSMQIKNVANLPKINGTKKVELYYVENNQTKVLNINFETGEVEKNLFSLQKSYELKVRYLNENNVIIAESESQIFNDKTKSLNFKIYEVTLKKASINANINVVSNNSSLTINSVVNLLPLATSAIVYIDGNRILKYSDLSQSLMVTNINSAKHVLSIKYYDANNVLVADNGDNGQTFNFGTATNLNIELRVYGIKDIPATAKLITSSTPITPIPNPENLIITIGSYNPENVWDNVEENSNITDIYDDYLCTKNAQGVFSKSNWCTDKILEAKIKSFITSIKLSGIPDVVSLQELESAKNQSEVFTMTTLSGKSLKGELEKLGYKYFLVGEQNSNNPVSVTSGFISKYKLVNVASVDFELSESASSARDVPVVELYINDQKVARLYSGHWPSKKHADNYREKIATAVRNNINTIKQQEPNLDILVLGDLNAYYYENAVVKNLGSTGDESAMTKNTNEDKLYNLWYELPINKRYNYSYNGQNQNLDNYLISDKLYDNYGLQYVDNSFKVIGQSITSPEGKVLWGVDGSPFRWQIIPANKEQFHKHIGVGYSDHLPLVASYKVWLNNTNLAKSSIIPSSTVSVEVPKELNYNEVNLCDNEEVLDLKTLDFGAIDKETSVFANAEKYVGKCVKLNGSYPLNYRGKYSTPYVKIGADTNTQVYVNLTMTRSYDFRPNIDEFSRNDSYNNPQKPHPLSNMCYVRNVLQDSKKTAATLNSVLGRLGYTNGYLSIFTARRKDMVFAGGHPRASACPSN